jgi:lipid A 3-O-deacylase
MLKNIIKLIILSVVFDCYPQVFTLEMENDVFSDSDRDYTHGTKISYKYYLDREFPEYEYISHSIFQFIYTPNNIEIAEPQLDDRPWAGMLGYEYWRVVGNNLNFTGSGFQVGVIGPHSYSEKSQKKVHEWIDSREPMGWDNQIDDRLFVSYLGQIGFKYIDAKYFDLSQNFNLLLGTSFTNVGSSIIARTGWNIPHEFSRSGMEPSARNFGAIANIRHNYSAYIFYGAEFRYVPYNELITDSENDITLSNFVNDFFVGLGLTYKKIDVIYQYVWRGREFQEDDTYHSFTKIAISYRF